jgi:stage III sporulation protein AD
MAVKKESPVTALFISITGGTIIVYMLIPKLSVCFESLFDISLNAFVSSEYIEIILKITGISYLAEFCTQLCADCGQTSIGSKIEIAAKVFIMAASMPVIMGLIESVNSIMP